MAENEFARPGDASIYRLIDLAQIAFWAGQEAENGYGGPGDPLIHRSLDLEQVAFSAV
jgi:hypothetical protein